MFIFFGNSTSIKTLIPIALPIASIWMTNRMLYGDHEYKLFKTVPVSRKYIVLNIFLLSFVFIFIVYLLFLLSNLVFVAIIAGISYLVYPKIFSQSPPGSAVHQMIDTTKGDTLMLCIFALILFAGVAITFIKNKKHRLKAFAAFAVIGYSLLFLLKLYLKMYMNSDKIGFLESFSIVPNGSILLLCVAIATVIISITSVFIGHKLYVCNSTCTKFRNS
jgi:hypothetical protein